MSNNEENTDLNGADNRIYEIGYLLVPTVAEENVPALYGNLKELIASLGGEVISDDMPAKRELAYRMEKVIENIRHKFDSGYFGWVKFSIDPEKIEQIKKKLDFDPNFIRFLIIKTVKENTIAAKRFVHRAPRPKVPGTGKTEGEPAPEINKEEIDKEIDAMVAVQ